MPMCDFNKVAKQLHFGMVSFPVTMLHNFRTPFPKNTSGGLPLPFH